MRSALFGDTKQQGMVVCYRCFGTTCQSHYPKTSVRNSHSMLRKIPKQCGSQLSAAVTSLEKNSLSANQTINCH